MLNIRVMIKISNVKKALEAVSRKAPGVPDNPATSSAFLFFEGPNG